MHLVTHKDWGDVLCTLGHEVTHRTSNLTGREMSEPLFKEALELAHLMVGADIPGHPFEDFAKTMNEEWWYTSAGNYLNPEGEALARAYETTCYRATPYRHDRDSLDDAQNTLQEHLDTLWQIHNPYVSARIMLHMEQLIATDIPAASATFARHLTSNGNDRVAQALHDYNAQSQTCTSSGPEICAAFDNVHAMAKPSLR